MLHWYWQEVRGNVLALVPCGIAAFLWLRSKHLALTTAHRAHSEKLVKILDSLDETSAAPKAMALMRRSTTPRGINGFIAAPRWPGASAWS